jgi:hypothetical protein
MAARLLALALLFLLLLHSGEAASSLTRWKQQTSSSLEQWRERAAQELQSPSGDAFALVEADARLALQSIPVRSPVRSRARSASQRACM